MVGIHGSLFEKLPDGTFEKVGPATAEEIELAGVVVQPLDASVGTNSFAANRIPPAATNPTLRQLDRANELGVDPRWVNSDGSIIWPTKQSSGFDGGFHSPPTITEIQPGTRFDRYGGDFENGRFVDTGVFVSPSGVPFEQRSLPPSSINRHYQEYEVLKPIPNVNSGTAAAWFGQPGGGTQFQMPLGIGDLVQRGFIRPVFD